MLSWTIFIVRASYALAVHSTSSAHAANTKEVFQLMMHQQQKMQMQSQEVPHASNDKLSPTQPIHRSILSHRKRTILRENNISGDEPKKGTVALLRSLQPNDDEQPSPLSPEEPTPPLLASEWWVKIQEEVGQNSFNFVPESRRAASSVVFTYKYDKERLLTEEEDGILSMDDNNETVSESLTQGIESDVDDANNRMPNNATTEISTSTTEEAQVVGEVVVGESNKTNITEEEAGHEHTLEAPKQQMQGSSATATTTNAEEEYMIISGGYTDHDWKSFPVYAFPLTSSIRTLSGQWIDLSPSASLDGVDKSNVEESRCNDEDGAAAREKLYQEAVFLDTKNDHGSTAEDPWELAQHCAPSGRMGHQSVIHNDKLYVFGGLIYDEEQSSGGYGKKEAFRLEDVPFVYRLDLNEMFQARKLESKGQKSTQSVTGWQRIIPRVTPFSTPNGMSSTSAAEVLLTSVNRGEMQGGLWSSETTGGHDKLVIYGGLRIATSEYEGHNGPSKFVKGETTFGSSSSQMHSHKIVELPLGDVWAYDLVLDSWEKITNSYGRAVKGGIEDDDESTTVKDKGAANKDDDDWWYDLDTSLFPRPRTAHAATVVGNELVIHGGMGWNEHTNDWDGSTDWETLDDMWILDLSTREWTRRWLFPLLVRSYHSLVGWSVDENMMGWGKDFENCTSWEGPVVAAFGGYTTGIDVFSGEELAYVFDDLLVSYPPPPNTNYDELPSPWLKASMNVDRDGAELITTRYEHSAVLSKQGVLVVWGGSFQDTSRVKGMWMINIAGKKSSVNLSMAEADSIYNEYERTITALHTIVIMLMFMSISLTLLLGLTQRYQELVQQANDDAAVAAGVAFAAQDFGTDSPPTRRGNGLHPEIIDTIPRKTYRASENDGNGGTEEGDQECCPICLVEYQEGDDLRVLPCSHFMHRACLDAWLANNPSCPSCRYSLSELVDDRPMMQLRTLRSRLSNNSALARFLGHDYVEGGIEMTDNFSDGSLPGEAIDLRYISSLALSEEDDAMESVGEDRHQGGNAEDPPTRTTAMDELSSWRSRRRRLQRDRRSLSSMRQNVSRIRSSDRRSRIPLADLDEEY
mmetsp:Transcript_22306/g.40050  ORF Transcript_22306/g.40050 Transcript_22306/m.40050 type:complete len:1087 (+) Transcript_22306:137-3397(+)